MRSGLAPVPHSSSCTMTSRPWRLGELDPEMAELAEAGGEHLVAGRSVLVSADSQAPVPLDGKMTTWPSLVLKILFKSLVERQSKLGKVGGAMVLHGDMHGPQDAIRHIGRPGTNRKLRPGFLAPAIVSSPK